jgi:UDP-N-acetylmuramate--alanine ligase
VIGLMRKVHFVGVGGIGMSGLAEILLNLGYEVSGSDLRASEITQRLETLGLTFFEGHDAAQLGDAGILVVSAAVADDNVEVVAARLRGTPVIHRSELLADLMRMKACAVAVGGTHGKTTTTSMISAFLDTANIGATTIVGGILHRSGTNARWGTGDCLVAEADEHDGSFLRLHPTIAVVTSIDAEHLEYYGTLDTIKRAFLDYSNSVPFYGYSIVCWDDPNVRAIHPQIESVCITYGLSDEASLTAVNIRTTGAGNGALNGQRFHDMRTSFDVVSRDDRLRVTGNLGAVTISALGDHNVRNALGACAVGLCLGMRFGQIADGLKAFDGVQRRLHVRGEARGVVVIEDYAHHPTEIASTLQAVRLLNPRRVLAVFQPHLYSRTKFFSEEFARVLATADLTLVTEIYGSREAPMPGVDAGLIVDAARAHGCQHVELVRAMHDTPAVLANVAREGDIILVIGAGNIDRVVPGILESLETTGCRL